MEARENNGWICINRENDLPQNEGYYILGYRDGRTFVQGKAGWLHPMTIERLYNDGEITHYYPIEKPLPPTN